MAARSRRWGAARPSSAPMRAPARRCKRCGKKAEAALGHIDILVNNAGMLKNSFLAMTSEATWDEVLDVNLKAAFQLSKAGRARHEPAQAGAHHQYFVAGRANGRHHARALFGGQSRPDWVD